MQGTLLALLLLNRIFSEHICKSDVRWPSQPTKVSIQNSSRALAGSIWSAPGADILSVGRLAVHVLKYLKIG